MTKSRKKGLSILELIIVIAVVGISLPVFFNIFLLIIQSQKKVYILQRLKKNGNYAINIIQNTLRSDLIDGGIYTAMIGGSEVCSTKSGFSSPSSFGPTNILYFSTPNSTDRIFFREYVIDYPCATTCFFHKITRAIGGISSIKEYPITEETIKISNFKISCVRSSDFSPPLVQVSFKVSNLISSSPQEASATLDFQTTIKLRN